jgi:carbon monoxide dehydrogenase subunit G
MQMLNIGPSAALRTAGAALLALFMGTGMAADEITAQAERQGEKTVIDLTAHVASPIADTWAVLTDFEHMPQFISTVKVSTVKMLEPNRLELTQSSESRVGLFSAQVSSVRLVELAPTREIHLKLISGDFKAFESTTRLSEEPGGTLVTYHGEYVSSKWVPPVVTGGLIAEQTKKFWSELLAEAQRRRAKH